MKNLFLFLLFIFLSAKLFPQVENIRSFQYSFFDIVYESSNFIESGIIDYESDYVNNGDLYFQGNYNLSTEFSFAAELKFRGTAFNFDESTTALITKYNLMNDDEKISVGTYLELVTADPQYDLTTGGIGIWGAFKRELTDKLNLLAKAAMIYESEIFGANHYVFGAGLTYPVFNNLYAIAETNFTSSRFDQKALVMFSGGLDYYLFNGLNLRGAVGYNLLDSPLLLLNGGLAYSF